MEAIVLKSACELKYLIAVSFSIENNLLSFLPTTHLRGNFQIRERSCLYMVLIYLSLDTQNPFSLYFQRNNMLCSILSREFLADEVVCKSMRTITIRFSGRMSGRFYEGPNRRISIDGTRRSHQYTEGTVST